MGELSLPKSCPLFGSSDILCSTSDGSLCKRKAPAGDVSSAILTVVEVNPGSGRFCATTGDTAPFISTALS